MNRAMPTYADSISDSVVELKRFLDMLGYNPVIISHVDADGLCSAAILKRFLSRRGIKARQVYPGKGETAFSPGTEVMIRGLKPTSLFVLDLGVMDQEIAPGVPTVFIDHHRPFGRPVGAVVLSSYGPEPAPPTSSLAYNLLSRVTDIKDVEWLSAVGAAGDLGSAYVFAHGDDSVRQLKKSDVTEAEILINSAKRSSAYDIDTAIGLIDRARGVSDLVDRRQQAVQMLESYRAEVNREVKRCRHEKPQFSWKVAAVPFKSNCDIQGLIVEPWRRQLKKYLVIAANFGYLEGKVAYVIRTELETSVIDFMESIRPAGLDSHVVFGHDRAGGAVLDTDLWYRLADRMGYRNKG
jgi:single-stranded-DNA-specific exonuclease